jgi:hypothetical protein
MVHVVKDLSYYIKWSSPKSGPPRLSTATVHGPPCHYEGVSRGVRRGGSRGFARTPLLTVHMFYIITYFPSVASRTRPLCLPGSDCAHKTLVLGLDHAPSIQNGRVLIKRGVVYKILRALRAHCATVTPLSKILRTPLVRDWVSGL